VPLGHHPGSSQHYLIVFAPVRRIKLSLDGTWLGTLICF